MSPDNLDNLDDPLADRLAAMDARLAAGLGADTEAEPDLPPEQLRLFRMVRASLLHLEQTWPRTPRPEPAELPSAYAPDAPPGAGRLGKFRLLRELGRGGNGVVFLAEDTTTGHEVALKLPCLEALLDPDLRRRFLQEARLTIGLDHPAIVPVYEAGEVGVVCYLVSEYAGETSLAGWLDAQTEAVPARAAAALLAALARGVHYLHDHYLLHRDIKPSNILLGPALAGALPDPDLASVGVPRLTDFGLAKLIDATQPAAAGLTTGGLLVGTAEYMAPEQAAGRPEQLGRPADVYALGAVLYELLVRRPPFCGRNRFDTLRRAQTEEPARPRRLRPDVPRDLEAVCLRALAHDPRHRFATAGQMAEDLQRFLAGQRTLTRPTPWWRRTLAWIRRRQAATALTLTAAAAVLALVVVLAAAERDHRRVRAKQLYQALWTTDLAELAPVAEQLRDYLPFVEDDLRPLAGPANPDAAARLRAALVLADRDGPASRYLEERIDDVTPEELHLICTALGGRPEVLERLEARPDEPDEPDVRRRANRALALARFGRTGPALDGLRSRPDPDLRYHLLHGLGPCRIDPAVLAAELGSADDAVRAALLLALGDYAPGAVPEPLRVSLRDRASALFRDDPDPGVHSAAEWLLRRWGTEATGPARPLSEALAHKTRWYTTKEGQTLALVAFPPAGRPAGSPVPFALATTEVTVEQFLRFRPHHPYQQAASPGPSCPVNDVSFALAAAYCNWLSERERVPPDEYCYKLSGEPDDPDLKVIAAVHERSGYRLPTDAEWEYACRAGTTTAHFFGESAEYLPRYAWYARNSDLHNWPVGRLRPNPLGLFDVYGNVLEWCARDADFLPEHTHVFRGGGARNKEAFQRSTTQQEAHPTYYHEHLGFRPARTLPDGPAAEPPARNPLP